VYTVPPQPNIRLIDFPRRTGDGVRLGHYLCRLARHRHPRSGVTIEKRPTQHTRAQANYNNNNNNNNIYVVHRFSPSYGFTIVAALTYDSSVVADDNYAATFGSAEPRAVAKRVTVTAVLPNVSRLRAKKRSCRAADWTRVNCVQEECATRSRVKIKRVVARIRHVRSAYNPMTVIDRGGSPSPSYLDRENVCSGIRATNVFRELSTIFFARRRRSRVITSRRCMTSAVRHWTYDVICKRCCKHRRRAVRGVICKTRRTTIPNGTVRSGYTDGT